MLTEDPATRELIELLRSALANIATPSPVEEVRVYSLAEVAEITSMAQSGLLLDCRAGRLEHIRRGRTMGMTLAQIRQLVRVSTAAQETAAKMTDMDWVIETSRRSWAARPTRRRTA